VNSDQGMPVGSRILDSDAPDSELASLLMAAKRMVDSQSQECSSNQQSILSALASAGRRGLTQVQLAELLGVTAATMSRSIDSLERQGVIVRITHPLDRRSKIIQSTEKGRQLLLTCREERLRHYEQAFEGLSSSDLDVLKTLLKRISENLGSMPGARLRAGKAAMSRASAG